MFGVYEKVLNFIKEMPKDIPGLFEKSLHRIEVNYDGNEKKLLIQLLSLLVCSRGGIIAVNY